MTDPSKCLLQSLDLEILKKKAKSTLVNQEMTVIIIIIIVIYLRISPPA